MGVRVRMPEDWDDHEQWERCYSGVEATITPESLPLPTGHSAATRFAGWLEMRGYRRLWFPGCGVDGSPRVYASLGCEVWASDVSPSAVGFQRLMAEQPYDSLGERVMEGLRRYLPELQEWRQGVLHALVHDFRDPFPIGEFDCILNIRAYQELPPESLRRAARTFFAALRPGGRAFFDTQNVQGERRDWLEDALLEAGFALPGNDLERCYRRAVADTGIPHLFVLGSPFVARGDERYQGEDGTARIEADQAVLKGIRDEYRRRAEADSEEAQRVSDDPQVRTAAVVYNTG